MKKILLFILVFVVLLSVFDMHIKAQILCPDDHSVNTAIGCVPVLTNENDFAAYVYRWGLGVGGGIAFILLVIAGFIMLTSQGNPEKLKAGQELLTAAIAGLMLLIFSIFILEFIGVRVLGIF